MCAESQGRRQKAKALLQLYRLLKYEATEIEEKNQQINGNITSFCSMLQKKQNPVE